LPCLIQLPVFGGGLVGVIEDGVIEERIRHRGDRRVGIGGEKWVRVL
jgi:hypothetical protein